MNALFQYNELYLQNFLMVFPLVADHPLREGVEIVEGNLDKKVRVRGLDNKLRVKKLDKKVRGLDKQL